MRYILPIFILGLSAPGFAQIDTGLNCPGGTVIELDGQIICEKQDSLALLISDFEAAELAGDVYRRGQEGDRDALKQLPNITPEASAAHNAITTQFLARHAALSAVPMREEDRLNYDLLGFVLKQRQRLAPFDTARVPFTNDSGFFNELSFVLRQTDFKTAEDYEAYAARLRIRQEMDAIIQETGFNGSFAEFLNFLRTDPQFYATSRDDLLMRASYIAKQLDGKMPEFFATLPRLSYGVIPVPREIEKTYTTGRYFSGNPERGKAGNYVVNTYNLPNRPLYNLPALTAHEGVPGHHMQISIGQELQGLPKFRQSLYPNAFGEGWGLYAEKLAGEMGIYKTPYEKFGQLSYEMWRACRLVVDTGLHWKGWTREEAENCFLENSALAPHNIKTEVQRYISWPGQALAYKVGELKILELRARAEAELGADFDIRRFHDAVLSNGGIPLDILENQISRYIFNEKQRLAQSLPDPTPTSINDVQTPTDGVQSETSQ